MTDQLFSEIWVSAQYNAFFWTAHGIGLLCLVLGLVAGWKNFARYKHLATIAGCCIGIIVVISVAEKWRIREDAAQTMKQKQAVAERDGENLGMSPFVGGVVGASYLLFSGLCFKFGDGAKRAFHG